MTKAIKGAKDFGDGFVSTVKEIGIMTFYSYKLSFEIINDYSKALRKIKIERKIEKLKDKLKKMEEA